MKVLKKYKTPLERQIGEALEIERRSWTADCLLNKKEEYNGTKIPRLRLESVEIMEEVKLDHVDDDKKNHIDSRNRMRSNWPKQPAQKRKVEEEIEFSKENKNNKFKKRKLTGHTQACPEGHTQACPRGKIIKQVLILDDSMREEEGNKKDEINQVQEADKEKEHKDNTNRDTIREVESSCKTECFVEFIFRKEKRTRCKTRLTGKSR